MADDPVETSRDHFERQEIDAQDPAFLLAQGEHLGFAWVVAHDGQGYRCGYVRIPPGHPWHGRDRSAIDAAVHGGLTAQELSPRGNYWIGFDAAHAWDLPDLELPMPPFVREVQAWFGGWRTRSATSMRAFGVAQALRGQAYVEAECRSLCSQAAAAADRGH